MNIQSFISSHTAIFQQLSINEESVCYIAKLSNLTKRNQNPAPTGRFGGMMQGIGNFVNNTIASVSGDMYMVRTTDSNVYLISEKNSPLCFNINALQREAVAEPGGIKASVLFPGGDIETATIKLTSGNISDIFGGDMMALISDFDRSFNGESVKMLNGFAGIRMSKHPFNAAEPYSLESFVKSETIVTYDDSGIYMYNEKKNIPYNKILVYSKQNGYYRIVFEENGTLVFAEIYDCELYKTTDLGLNVINTVENNDTTKIIIPIPDSVMKTDSFLSLVKVNTILLVSTDADIYYVKNLALYECGIFENGDDIYVKTSDNITEKHMGCKKLTEVLPLIPSYNDNIFKNRECTQPVIMAEQIVNFTINDNNISSEAAVFEFDKMENYHYSTTKFGSTLEFTYNTNPVTLSTSNSLGVLISNMQEKVCVNRDIESYNINQLYDYYFKRNNKNLMAGTFSELFKTNKLLNNNSDINDVINTLRSEDSEVLRSAFKSFVGKFKNIDDFQSELIEKISLLEIQRKKIQKMSDEWTLYFPHFMATMQVKWLKSIFGQYVSEDMLQNEYWKCVNTFKKMLSGCNAYIQKSMNEIGACVNPLSSALPDDVKRADITSSLRINAVSKTDMLKAGSNALLAASTVAELTILISRGMKASNPMMLAMSAKSLIDSYSKDVNMRKNIKIYGMQALEWWKIAMKGIQIQILEMSHAINEYNKLWLKRDTDLFIKLPDNAKIAVKEKLTNSLKGKIVGSVDEKFLEILPQLNVRISNIIEDIESNSSFREDTMSDFCDNLYI